MLIKAAVIYEKGNEFSIEDVELAEPKYNEVLVKIIATGVCHTDAVVRDQLIPTPLPIVLGHEGAGIIEKLGHGVTGFEVGDHVAISFSSCGCCNNCLEGHVYLCENFNELNFGGIMNDKTTRLSKDNKDISTLFGQSSFATYSVVNVRNITKVDKDVDLRLVGPLGCGVQTGAGTVLNRLKPEFGSSIVVFGCGSVGFSAIMAAKLTGCSKIIAVGRNAEKLELAKELGATHVVNSKEVTDVVAEIKKITNGGANYSVETTGIPEIVNQSLYALRALGTCAILGVSGDVNINVFNALMGEGKSMIGVIEGDSVPQVFIPKMIQYYK
ncbi:NAD(P)-dependent alcohol dehydrogenase [Clostridium sp. CF012]|uniref:NAD(P)-dependent alcohol dehydrogenase n=1 Tax=Clostridium sp. CF012 TaxID=2843319 RepID=UPI002815DB95|nr:NAD(P)-dependent alcohol dehydrogenase [Clostridium sp. CF012]